MTDPKQTPDELATQEAHADEASGATRREFLVTATAATVGGAILLEGCSHVAPATEGTAPAPTASTPAPVSEVEVTLTVNGHPRTLKVDPRTSLLDALRERMQLTGTKKGCDHGQCGACTVLVNGRRELSCLSLAVMQQGSEVVTVEGLSKWDTLHPLQQAFLENDAFQCGYCTPGQLMSAIGLMSEPCGTSDADVRECMSGNLCRCSAYPNIVAAIQQVRRLSKPKL